MDYRAWLRQYLSPRAWWAWIHAHPWASVAILIAGFGARVFTEVVEGYYEKGLAPVDHWIQQLIFAYRTPVNTAFAQGISDLLVLPGVLVLLLPVFIALLAQRRMMAAWVYLLVPSLTGLLVEFLKNFFHRQRPLDGVIYEPGNSFPSGHATGSIVLYGLLGYILLRYWVRPRWARALIILVISALILLTGLARVYLQVHFPSDVAAGWGAGAVILAGAMLLLEAWEERIDKRRS